MVLDLISLTFNFIRWPLFWGLLFLIGCSSKSTSIKGDPSRNVVEDLSKLAKSLRQTDPGPTQKNKGLFVDQTAAYGLENLAAVAINAVDLNLDGRTDLVILPNYYSRPKFYIYNSAEKKYLPWKHDPLPTDFKASYMLFYDLNHDRIPDLISGVLNQKSELREVPVKFYLGKIERGMLNFIEKPQAISLTSSPASSVSLIDFDLDGQLDLFISNWFATKNGENLPVADRLLRNKNLIFEDVSLLLKGETIKSDSEIYPPNARPTYGSSTCDIDQNGFPDILTVSSSGHSNKLWMNLKDTQTETRLFEDIGKASNYGNDQNGMMIASGGGRSFFSACADYNDDGIMDVFLGELSHAYDNDSVDKSSILTGSKETYPPYFLRTEYLTDTEGENWNQGDRRGTWVDMNLDGHVDLLVDNSGFPPHSRLVLFEQHKDHSFSNTASALGIDIVNPIGTIVLDVNHDGRMDILTAQNNIRSAEIKPRLYLFVNHQKSPGRKSIRVHLGGNKANSSGIGSMVMLYTTKGKEQIIQRRWAEFSQGGLPSQNELGVHFGVDKGVNALGVKVRWPILKKNGFSLTQTYERLYSLKGYLRGSHTEVTLCEDGRVLHGKTICID